MATLVEQWLELDNRLSEQEGGSPEEMALLREIVELGDRMTEEERFAATAVKARTREAWRSAYDKVNEVTLEEHWRRLRNFDPALPPEPSDDPKVLRRAFLGAARMLAELDHEWC
jgi:hypothetical protein